MLSNKNTKNANFLFIVDKHSRSLFAEAVNACYNENCDE